MAFDYFPKNATALYADRGKLKTLDSRGLIDDVASILDFLNKKFPNQELPIALDPVQVQKASHIKLRKTLVDVLAKQGESNSATADNIRRALASVTKGDGSKPDLKKLGFSFGDGSRGNKGTQNRGLKFEDDVVASFEVWKQGEPYEPGTIIKPNIEKFILELVDMYKLTKYSQLIIVPEGALNKSRPLNVNASGMYVGNSPTFDIGATVTDVTVKGSGASGSADKVVYLSLKKGSTVSYFGVGLGTSFLNGYPSSGQVDAKYKHKTNFIQLCKHFGIDIELFDQVFRYKTVPTRPLGAVTPKNYNKQAIGQLIKSAIGYGFHMVHLFDTGAKEIKHYPATAQYMNQNAQIIGAPTIYYGGKASFSRRVTVEVQTKDYRRIEFAIRNKTNTALAPKDLLSNFYYK